MSVIVDTGVLVAAANKRDRHQSSAKTAMRQAFTGRFGKVFASDYIFDEIITLTLKRTRSHHLAMTMANQILGRSGFPHALDLLMMTGPTFREALAVFERYSDQGLSFTDATTVALMRRRGIDQVLSFDAGFDGIVHRLDPKVL